MRPNRSLLIAVPLALAWLAACYALRYLLMEDPRWVAVCGGAGASTLCEVRSTLGLMIHFGVLAWTALLLALPAFVLGDPLGRRLAWAGLFAAIPALVLYTVTLASVALLLTLLRLVRTPRHSAAHSTTQTPAQPSA